MAAPSRLLVVIALFGGAALVFLAEPLFARQLLPRVGGSPAVWSVCVAFYQLTLLAGYAYAHGLARLRVRWQVLIHAAALLAGGAFLPLALGGGGATGRPALFTLQRLALDLGMPFFALAATAPLVQRWYVLASPERDVDPYPLYAASNAGSLVALVAYPFAIEPLLGLGQQSRWWTIAYALVAFAILLTAPGAWRTATTPPAPRSTTPLPSVKQRLFWVLLAAVPASLSLGLTLIVTTTMAPLPLFWVAPLAVYLATFLLAFSPRHGPTLTSSSRWLPLLLLPLVYVHTLSSATASHVAGWWAAGLHLAVLALGSYVCHRRLFESRPNVEHLTSFYLYVALGGVVGGGFNALIAPALFDGIAEYPLALALLAFCRVDRSPRRGIALTDVLAVAGIAVGAIVIARMFPDMAALVPKIALGALLMAVFAVSDRTFRFGAAVGAFLLLPTFANVDDQRWLLRARSFYGVVQVGRDGSRHYILHGDTLHNVEDRTRPGEPLAYYSRGGPVGDVFLRRGAASEMRDVFVIGLGAGAMAAYATPGARWTFAEIDPLVERIARDKALFTYLPASRGTVEVAMGDGRLLLAAAAPRMFDVIVVDAFTSDSVPFHLLTLEALDTLLARLRAGGVVLFHTSNRFLRVDDVVLANAHARKLPAWVRGHQPSPDEGKQGVLASQWIALARKAADIAPLDRGPTWQKSEHPPPSPPWTDDHTALAGIVRW